MSKTQLIFVVHKGNLETQSLLLAASLRFFNQKNFNLIACVPNNISSDKNFITQQTENYLNDLNVNIKDIQNPINSTYLIGNKLRCLNATIAEHRLFLDTDILCAKELNLPTLKSNEIAVKPADRKTYQWNTEQWQYAYKKYAHNILRDDETIFSSAFREPMLPYFNAGVIYINGCHDFSHTWSQIAKAIDNDDLLKEKRPWLDQLTLPLAIKKLDLDTHLLSEQHNFPANIKAVNPDKGLEIIHYHRPSVLADNQYSIETIIKIIGEFPWLLDVFKKDEDWQCVANRIDQHIISPPKNHSIKHIFKTQLSPTSYEKKSIRQLGANDSSKVIEKPSKILKPISRRLYPWGMTAYLNKIEYETKLFNQNIHEIYYLLDNSLIFSISRIKTIFPQCTIVIKIKSPIDTIKGWGDDFLIESSDEFFFLEQQKQWFRPHQLNLLNHICNTNVPMVRNALYWCMLAQELIDHRSLISIDIEKCKDTEQANALSIKPPINDKKEERIWSIISKHYSDLVDCK